MEQKLYYTRQELFSQPHTRFMETENNICFNLLDGDKFVHYKKLYLLQKNAPDVTEIYVEVNTYLIIKELLSKSKSKWLNEFDGWVFTSIKEMMEAIDYACKHKLF